MYQGIFDTDFDKYTEDAVAPVQQGGGRHRVRESRRLSRGLEDQPRGVRPVRPGRQCPSFIEYGEYPYVTADEIKKALKIKTPCRRCSTNCSDIRRHRIRETTMNEPRTARTYNQHHSAPVHPRPAAGEHLRGVELPGRGRPQPGRAGQPVLHDDRGAPGDVARVRGPAMVRSDALPAGHRRRAGAVLLGLGAVPALRRGDHRPPGARVPAHRPGRVSTPLDERVLADTDTLFVFGLDHMVTGQDAAPEEIEAVREWLDREGTCLVLGPHHDVGALGRPDGARDGVPPPRRRAGAPPATLRPVHPIADGRAGRARCENRYGLRPAVGGRNQIAPCPSPGTWTPRAGSRA